MTTQQAALIFPGIQPFSAIRRGLGTLVDRLRHQWRAQRTRAALRELDPRMLRDIGIEHSDMLVLTTIGTDAVVATRKRVIHQFDRAVRRR